MQELIEQLKEERDGFLKLPPHSNIQERTENCFGSCIEIAERMLEKEKDVIIEAFHEGMRCQGWDPNRGIAEEYYNETFNTEERPFSHYSNTNVCRRLQIGRGVWCYIQFYL
jgi:hypothetical protein